MKIISTNICVLIPAYSPSHALVELVERIVSQCNCRVVIVNDGSPDETIKYFDAVGEMAGVEVVCHATNLGKGAALKTGFNHILCGYPEMAGIVTADADGQHLVDDIFKVVSALQDSSDQLILGIRNWDKGTPLRSRFGNIVTKYVFWFLTGINLRDTQTGLRGIPAEFARHLLKIRSAGYEFELDMLIASKACHVPISCVDIKTVYFDDNRGSHFNPIWDSMKIYFVFLRFVSISLMTALIDFVIFTTLVFFGHGVAVAMSGSRLFAGLFQFTLSKRLVFRHRGEFLWSITKFFSLVLGTGLFSFSLIEVFTTRLGMPVIASKIFAEGLLFLASFTIQREFVFRKLIRRN